ncbi:receptor binding tail protein [Lactococcus phage 38507]|uniref:Putative receptor binding protein n=1 Tax=Lactococcus phage 38507 TaxID=2029663 RepID=A0A343JPA6_9CAUD|nr:receptor binding tail protein [Lactococcus phage 38507]ASZ71329.1 putative receptor binding protein [Lactococcus phage 38507]
MTIKNFTFFSPNGTEFPVGSNNDGKLYMMLTGMDYGTIRRKDWSSPLNTALNVQYTNTSIIAGGRYFELSNETVALKPNSVNYIHANIDLTQTTHPVSLSAESTDESNKVDLNNNSGVLKVVIDIRTTNGTGVISHKIPDNITYLDKVITNSLEMKGFADSYVAFFANKGGGNTVTFTAPWDCTAEVELFYHGWGFAGGEWEIGITTPYGLTQIYEATGYTNGHESKAVAMPAKAIYSGLKKGQQYTFDKRDVRGGGGGAKAPMMIVKLYRN